MLADCVRLHQSGKQDIYLINRQFIFKQSIPDQYAWVRAYISEENQKDPSKCELQILYGIDEYMRLVEFEAAHKIEFPVSDTPLDFGDRTILPYVAPPQAAQPK
jgi:hypothetical protein